jgi:D-alanine--poly(phosphoribitol) ligase subunit 1
LLGTFLAIVEGAAVRHCFNLAGDLAALSKSQPDDLAIGAAGERLSYGDLAAQAAQLAGHLAQSLGTRRVGILGTRSAEAYIGILAACWAGATYVPLNLKWPAERLIELMRQLQLDALVADDNGAALLSPDVLAAAPDRIIVPDGCDLSPARRGQRVDQRGALSAPSLSEPAPVSAEDTGYIIFTSGTTGLPKGVMISAGSLAHYLEQSEPWTCYTPDDRIGEACDVTFDLSVHNLFLCLRAGASLHVMSQLEMLAPARFIRSHALTVWMSVPTVIALMRQTGALKPGIFPSLRLSIFCGEPLPVPAVQAWAEATPNGVVENIYGPTECTVIGLRQRLTSPPVVTEGRDILAIGKPYPTMTVAILDAQQQPVAAGQPGEIALKGPQLGIGYFGQPELTAERFRTIRSERWYLTGDLGRMDADGVFHHLGRVDNQIKLKGNRVELEEVDAHLRRAAGTELVATVAWPMAYGSAEGLVAFVAGSAANAEEIRHNMAQSLPRYLVPGRIVACATLPQNINGKIDRGALTRMLDCDELPALAS